VFGDGLSFYNSHNTEIIRALERDIARSENEIQQQAANKEANFRLIFDFFENALLPRNLPVVDRNKELAKAVKTLRKVPRFGDCDDDYPVNFIWPTENDLLSMPTDRPIHAAKLKWKMCHVTSTCIGCLTVILSNGTQSPFIKPDCASADNMQEIALSSEIQKLNGTGSQADYDVGRVDFMNARGEVISKIQIHDKGFGEEYSLNAGEEIIGIYGHR